MVKSFRGPQRKERWLLVAVVILALLVPVSAAASPATPDMSAVIWKQACPGTITIIPEGAATRHVVCYDSVAIRAKTPAVVIWKQACPGTIAIIPEGTAAHVVCSVAS